MIDFLFSILSQTGTMHIAIVPVEKWWTANFGNAHKICK
jgi:hypothetical protein